MTLAVLGDLVIKSDSCPMFSDILKERKSNIIKILFDKCNNLGISGL